MRIPADLKKWLPAHVKSWVQWAVRQFNLTSVTLVDWDLTGAELYDLTLEEFQRKVPNDPGELFWMHLEVLRSSNCVGKIFFFILSFTYTNALFSKLN